MSGFQDSSMTGTQDRVFIHIPLRSFAEYRPKIADHRMNIEVLVTSEDLDSQPHKSIEEIGRFLEEHRLSCTIHGPFLDLNPGSSDSKIRRVSQERYQELLTLVAPLDPKVVVFHAAFDPLFYGDRAEVWLERSVETWLFVAQTAQKTSTRVALENIVDRTPEMIQQILLKVNSPLIGVCFDVGHFHIFSQAPLSEWIVTLGARIFELHLHDNHGQSDEHLALGEGNIDIQGLFNLVQEQELSPALTIEAINEEHALLSFQRLFSYLLKKGN
jgi:sugar phosphate isomerase/epimerase